jgi:hypothetical protein
MFLKIGSTRADKNGIKEVTEISMSLAKNSGILERRLSRLLDYH